MKTFYIYPIVFTWDNVVPTEYPFINIKGPDGSIGVLMVFEDRRAYDAFAADGRERYEPLLIQQPERNDNGEQNGRNGEGEGEGEVSGERSGGKARKSWDEANGVEKRGRKH